MESSLNSPNFSNYRPELIDNVSFVANRLYNNDYEYHNWQHIENTLTEARRLVTFCGENGLVVDQEVVELAVLLHDALFDVPEDIHPHQSKEEFSAAVTADVLQGFPVSADKTSHVQACILSTQRGVQCTSPEAIVVRRADLANVADNFDVFMENAGKLLKEFRRINGKDMPIEQWVNGIKQNLDDYFSENLSLGDFDRDRAGFNPFVRGYKRNIARLNREIADAARQNYDKIRSKLFPQAA